MSMFTRFKNIVLADLHHMFDQAEDPIRITKQYLRELEEQLVNAQKALSQQLLLEKKVETLVVGAEETVNKRVRQANLAIERNEDEIAKLALQDKIVQERKLAAYQQQYESIQVQTANLYSKIKELQEKYEELKLKHQELVARMQTAHAIQAMNQTMSALNISTTNRGFARMEEHVWAVEAKTEAAQLAAPIQPRMNPLLQAEVHQQLEQLKEAKKQA